MMKRKILLVLCMAAIAVFGICGLCACGFLGGGGSGGNYDPSGGGQYDYNYSLYFRGNGGKFSDGSASSIYYNHELKKNEVDAIVEGYEHPTRQDYIFDCWYLDADCTVKWTGVDNYYEGYTGIELFAGYIPTSFTLLCSGAEEFTVNETRYSDGRGVNLKLAENEEITITVRRSKYETGQTFLGWYNKNTDELLCEDMTYVFHMPASDLSLVARWITYTITINNEAGGTGSVKKTTSNYLANTYKGDVAGSETAIVATPNAGYSFVGWYDETGKLVSTDKTYSFIMPSENITFSTKWTYYTVTTLSEDNDGGEAGEIVNGYADTKVSLNANINLKATVNDGYVFVGWYDGDDLLSTELEHVVVMTKENRTFTARWTYYTATTEIGGNYGDGECAIVDGYAQTKVTPGNELTLKATLSEPYTFIGWYDDERLLSEELEHTVVMPSSNIVYTARFDKFTVTATSDGDGGTVSAVIPRTVTFVDTNNNVVGTQTLDYGDRIDIAAANELGWQTISGFRGWTDGSSFYDLDSDITDDLVLRISRFSSSNIINITQYSEPAFYYSLSSNNTYDFAIPTTGTYTFWYRQSAYDTTYSTSLYGPVIKLFNYTTNTWIYENTSNTGVPAPSDRYNQPFMRYRTFNANAHDIIRIYCNANPQYTYTTSADFYLEGEREHALGGSLANFAADGAKALSAGQTVTLNATPKDGYTFIGWWDGKSIVSTDETFSFVMGKASVEYTAKWARYTVNVATATGGSVALSATSATVTFDLNGKSGTAPEAQTVTHAQGLVIPEKPTADECLFRGWFTDAACTGEAFDFASDIDGDMTLYAGWYTIDSYGAIRYSVASDLYNYTADNPFRENSVAPNTNSQQLTYSYFVVPVSGQYKFYACKPSTAPQGRGVMLSGYIIKANGNSTGFCNLTITGYQTEYYTVTFTAGDVIMLSASGVGQTTYISSHEYLCWFDYLGDNNYPATGGGVIASGAGAATAVTGSEARAYSAGTSVTVVATANSGHSFDGWYDGNTRVSADEVYTFVMPEANVTLTPKFV